MGTILRRDIINNLEFVSPTSLSLPGSNLISVGPLQKVFTNHDINFGLNGLGGLDAGSLQANTLYYLYAVVSGGLIGLVASLNSNGPTGFPIYREIGKVITNAGSTITEPVNYGEDFTQYIKHEGAISHGSTAVNILRVNTPTIDTGSYLIDSIDSATQGSSWKTLFNKLEIDFSFSFRTGGSGFVHGLSKNASIVNNGIGNLPPAEQVSWQEFPHGNNGGSTWKATFQADSNEDYRIHSDGVGQLPFNNGNHTNIYVKAKYKNIV